jgi:hypothetical protein
MCGMHAATRALRERFGIRLDPAVLLGATS